MAAAIGVLAVGLTAQAGPLQDGIRAYQEGRYEEAVPLLQEAARQQAQDPVPVEWLTKVFEQTMDPAALNQALNELHRRKALLRPAAKPTAKPQPKAHKPAPQARIRLDGSTMPRREDELVDLGSLPTLPPDPLVHSSAPDAPPPQTSAWRRWRLQQVSMSLDALQATLRQLQSRFSNYAQAPRKVQQMTADLQRKIEAQSKVKKQLQDELGD